MIKIPIYHVDTFTDQYFSGNPAVVCLLKNWLPEKIMQEIATENNLPATVFLMQKNNEFFLRSFTPEYELDLCGHGTLAAAYIIFNQSSSAKYEIEFQIKNGTIKTFQNNEFICLELPHKEIKICQPPLLLIQGLGVMPQETYQQQTERYLAVLESEERVKNLKPDMEVLKKLEQRGVVVTARGETIDFVSRVFYPRKAISEDPVTGAAHCFLAPYWAQKLGKNHLEAYQVSPRGGYLKCDVQADNIIISGKAALYLEDTIFVDCRLG